MSEANNKINDLNNSTEHTSQHDTNIDEQTVQAEEASLEPETASTEQKNQEELELLKDQYLRLAADMENLRRRSSRDVAEAKSYAITSFARDLLSVSDNLQRALTVTESKENLDNIVSTVIEGIEMTQRELISVLEKHGITKINPKGEKFDPHFHQAIFEVPNPELPDNTVHEVIQEGFKIGDRILRPALVGICKNK